MSIMNVTDIILHRWLSIPEYLVHKMSKSMHIKVVVIETTFSCHDFAQKIGL